VSGCDQSQRGQTGRSLPRAGGRGAILLPGLKIYSARNVYYRFSVLAVISEHNLKPAAQDACFLEVCSRRNAPQTPTHSIL